MTEKQKDALQRAKDEVLNLLDVMDSEKPEVVGNLISEKLIDELLSSGLNMQFDSSPQKIKQSIKISIRAAIRKNK
jgi:hypothetical protein